MTEREKVIQLFNDRFNKQPERLFFAPGRVNLIGEHTDYNGGFVFPAALTNGTFLAIAERADNQFHLASGNTEQQVSFTNDDLSYRENDGWGNYIKGVMAAFAELGFTLKGADLFIWGTIPNGAGLSSSASLEMVTAYMISELTGAQLERVELAKLCQKVENQYMGVNSGIMDQFAVGLGVADHALFIDTASLTYETVPLDLGPYKIVITNTNKRRELADSKYNERRSECEEGLKQLQSLGLTISTLSELTLEQWQHYQSDIKDETISKRINHIVTENQRVKDAVDVLKKGDLASFGQLMHQSHVSLADDYDVTGKELDALVLSQSHATGCIGSRMTGAGFGGCTVSLVLESNLADFYQEVSKSYVDAVGYEPTFYTSDAGQGVHEL